MAILVDTGRPTLANLAARLDSTGKIAPIIEILAKKIPILEDAVWKEANGVTSDTVVSRTGLPSPTWRRFNQGVDPTKSTTVKYEETCGLLEAHAQVDSALAKLNGNSREWRLSEDAAQLEGMREEVSRAFWYESAATHSERVHGMTPRYPASSGYSASNYVLPKGVISGSNAQSVWLINWAVGKVCFIYPKGSMMGLEVKDLGEEYVLDQSGKQFLAMRTHYTWQFGVEVADYRYAGRVQWDPDDSTNFGDTGKSLYLAMQELLDQVYDVDESSSVFYMSRVSAKKFDAQLLSNTNQGLQFIQQGGKRVRSFMGIPLHITDTLVGESAIS